MWCHRNCDHISVYHTNVRTQQWHFHLSMVLGLECHVLPAICISCPFMLDEDGMSAVTMWIAGDFETDSGRILLLSALRHVVSVIFSVLPIHSVKSCMVSLKFLNGMSFFTLVPHRSVLAEVRDTFFLIKRCYVIKEVKFTLRMNFLCVLTKKHQHRCFWNEICSVHTPPINGVWCIKPPFGMCHYKKRLLAHRRSRIKGTFYLLLSSNQHPLSGTCCLWKYENVWYLVESLLLSLVLCVCVRAEGQPWSACGGDR